MTTAQDKRRAAILERATMIVELTDLRGKVAAYEAAFKRAAERQRASERWFNFCGAFGVIEPDGYAEVEALAERKDEP